MNKATLDIKTLTKPVTQSMPTGQNLRADASASSKYYQIKDARMAARIAERKYFEDNDEFLLTTSRASWHNVHTLAVDILTNLSKDLEVVTWLIEALLREKGFVGLAQGFELAAILIEKYWPDIYPAADEEGVFSKLIALAGLNGLDAEGTLELPIRCLPITDSQKTETYVIWQYKQSLEVERINDSNKRQKKYTEGVIPLEMIKRAAQQSGSKFYKTFHHDIEQASQAYMALCQVIEQTCPTINFPSSCIARLLEEASELISYLSGQKKEIVLNLPSQKPLAPSATELTTNFKNREEALQHLIVVANYFRDTEPQSLLPYILERANR